MRGIKLPISVNVRHVLLARFSKNQGYIYNNYIIYNNNYYIIIFITNMCLLFLVYN